MNLLITCPFWLSSLLNSELKHLGYKPYNTFPTGTYLDGDLMTLYNINLWSRIGNKVFILMWSANVFSFDDLFDFTEKINWWKILTHRNISIDCHTKNSELFAERTIQSITHKAILSSLTKMNIWLESEYKEDFVQDIFIHIENNFVQIFLNASGDSLHNRWYRTGVWEAPLKENIAASLILLAGWRFSDKFLDPFCWSWTILIEAAMIAKNIAPWLNRKFNFQKYPDYDSSLFLDLVKIAKSKEFFGDYKIFWSDTDQHLINLAKKNIENAWVSDCVNVEVADFFDLKLSDKTLVCNPPYGKRLELSNLDEIYEKLLTFYDNNTWWFLTSFPIKEIVWYDWHWKSKDINNNGEMCKFWRKK